MYQAQVVEHTFQNMLLVKRLVHYQVSSQAAWEAICDEIKHSKKTMGNLLHEVKTEYSIPTVEIAKLSSILQTRNHLAHKFFKVNSMKWFSAKGQEEMLQEMLDFIDRTRSIDPILESYSDHYKSRLNITDEKIEALKREMIDEERQR